jgi:hypothetical protein
MREDIQRLSTVLMAIYQERQQQLALYAALLEVEGSAAIAAEPSVISPHARAQGQSQRAGTAPAAGARDGVAPASRADAPAASAPPAASPPSEPPPTPVSQPPAPVPQTPAPAPAAPPGTPASGGGGGSTDPYTGILDIPMMIAP